MGRELRRVPKNWRHPRKSDPQYYPIGEDNSYHPLYDADYEEVATKWVEQLLLWEKGEHPDRNPEYRWYWDYMGPPPKMEYYRCKEYNTLFTEEPSCYQVYETVSEGTPVSPVFETTEEVVRWLVQEGYSEISARRFVEIKWAPSMMISGGLLLRDIASLE